MTGVVMVVDDSLTVRMDLLEAFESAAIPAIGCGTLAAAREALAGRKIALAILDLHLPDGSGTELLEEIRATPGRERMPILMLSTEAEVSNRIRGLAIGSDDYVGKPYDRDYMVSRVRELLGIAAGTGAGRRAKVLIIDDSPTFREELRRNLEGEGYEVVSAENGEEGLKRAASHRPSAVIVDGVLPGIDGATVVRKLRLDAALRKTPCLMLTGSTLDRTAELHALDAGADAFIRKEDSMDIVLARLAAALRASPEAAPTSPSLMGAKKIMAVDDSPTYLDALATTLNGEGYDVILARSGEEALELLSVQAVDCVLLDLGMPGLDGNEVCRRVKASAATRDIPLIMLTGEESREAMLESLGSGADDYVLKSSEDSVLKARVRAQLRRKQIEDESRQVRLKLLAAELQAAEAKAEKDLAEARAALSDALERRNRDLEAANKELESFSYSVSHDLRAPLRAIDGYSQMIEEDHAGRLDEEGRRLLRQVRAAALRMNGLIDDLLAFSRVGREPLKIVSIDMDTLVREVIAETAVGYPDASVAVAALPPSEGTRGLIKQVWTNLIGNARKYSSKNPAACVEIGARRDGAEVEYWVRDNGVGFDPRYMDKLFGVFQRLHDAREFPGTGVGLALAQRIVARHGGRMWAHSTPGEGATFHFTLPAASG